LRSPREWRVLTWASLNHMRCCGWRAALGLMLLSGMAMAWAAEPVVTPITSPVSTPAPVVSAEQIASAVTAMRASEASGMHMERRLRFKRNEASKAAKSADSSKSGSWLRELGAWLSEAGRGLMWLLGAIAVAVLIVFAWRWASVRADAGRARAVLRPSHVNNLDIRPESLPNNIAQAARNMWQRGEHRAALSLLYRGALSSLVHSRGVEIGTASTEGECVVFAQHALPGAASVFFERLVRSWQLTVYAGREVDNPSFNALCTDFDAHFAPTPPATPAPHGLIAAAKGGNT
jgi:hypothetical protein